MGKFLIIRFSSIGDIILTTPVIRCLKQQIDEAEVHYLTKRRYVKLITANPYVDKVHLLDKNLWWLLKELRKENFDYIIDLHKNIRTFLVKVFLNRIAFSFHKLNLKKWLLVNFKWDTLPQKHIVDRYLATLRLFSVNNDGEGLDYFIPAADKTDFNEILGGDHKKFVILVVGGGHYTKQIPEEKITELITNIDHTIALIGGTEDVEKAGRVLSGISCNNVLNLVGKLNLGETALLISKSEIVVTPDTGMMHIAAAFNKNIISIWGNTVPEFGMYPYNPGKESRIYEIKGLSCRPCSKIGFSACPRKHFRCMREHNMITIARTINKILESG